MLKKDIYLSVVITCYNEEANLKKGVLKDVYNYLSKERFSWEVVINDDGSSDKSREIIRKQIKDWKQFKLVESDHGGKPAGLLNGIKSAKGKYILFTDVDQSTPISEVDKLLPHLKKNVAAVIGSRGLSRKNFPVYRRLGAVVFASFRRLLILSEITDTQCGFKLFDARILKDVFPNLEVFQNKEEVKGWKVTSYDVELLHIIKTKGYKIVEVEVLWDDKDESKSKGSAISKYTKESKEMFFQILRVKNKDIKGLY